MSAEKIVITETKWEVQLPSNGGLTHSAEFEATEDGKTAEENARAAWADNQPSLLIKTVTETYMRGEVLEKWEARP